jgi:hypothetical protein
MWLTGLCMQASRLLLLLLLLLLAVHVTPYSNPVLL